MKVYTRSVLYVRGGESHQLQARPKLPLSQKVEVLLENIDATNVIKAQTMTMSNPLSATANENWVTVSL